MWLYVGFKPDIPRDFYFSQILYKEVSIQAPVLYRLRKMLRFDLFRSRQVRDRP